MAEKDDRAGDANEVAASIDAELSELEQLLTEVGFHPAADALRRAGR
jgi:hypothetical protein